MWKKVTLSKKATHDQKYMASMVVEQPRGQSSTKICVGNELKEDVEDTSKRISLKEKRVVQAETNRNYKLCDELSEQISELKQHN